MSAVRDALDVFTERNIEDWDFSRCDPGSPDYDVQADLFLSQHYVEVIAIDGLRTQDIVALVKAGIAAPTGDGRHVQLVESGDQLLAGWKSASSRFTRKGHLHRRIVESLRREHRKHGRIRIELGAIARAAAAKEARAARDGGTFA
jgi:hypothetical protein